MAKTIKPTPGDKVAIPRPKSPVAIPRPAAPPPNYRRKRRRSQIGGGCGSCRKNR